MPMYAVSPYKDAVLRCKFEVRVFKDGAASLKFGVPNLIFGVEDLIFGVEDLIFGVQSLIFWVPNLIFWVEDRKFGGLASIWAVRGK